MSKLRQCISVLSVITLTFAHTVPARGLGEEIISPEEDTTSPIISGVTAASLDLYDATIVWTTDEPAVSSLEYGTTDAYGSFATIPATALIAHSATLTNLEQNTIYYYCIHATDAAGNAADSCGHSFTTLAEQICTDTAMPTVSATVRKQA